MNTDQAGEKLLHGELTEKIIGIFYDVYNELGSGFLESVSTCISDRAYRSGIAK
jgi:hypothetical protein